MTRLAVARSADRQRAMLGSSCVARAALESTVARVGELRPVHRLMARAALLLAHDAKTVRLVTLYAVLQNTGFQTPVHPGDAGNLLVTPGRRARCHRLAGYCLFMGVVARAAHAAVRIVRGKAPEPAHGVAAEAFRRLRPQRGTVGHTGDRGGPGHGLGVVVTHQTMQREPAHPAELQLHAFMTAGLRARLVGGRKLVQRGGVAFHTLQTAQRGISGCEVHPVPDGVRDEQPFLGIALYVAGLTPLVRYFCVFGKPGRTPGDLRQCHLRTRKGRGLMAGLAPQPAVFRARETLVGLDHQVAGKTELVVVLDVVVELVAVQGGCGSRSEQEPRERHQRGRGKIVQPALKTTEKSDDGPASGCPGCPPTAKTGTAGSYRDLSSSRYAEIP